MDPLAAFQVIVLTLAAAMAVEALKADGLRRIIFWTVFGAAAVIGILTNPMADAWPTASKLMAGLGSSPISVFLLAVAAIVALNWPRRVKGMSDAAADAGDLEGTVFKHTEIIDQITDDLRRIEEDHQSIDRTVDLSDVEARLARVERHATEIEQRERNELARGLQQAIQAARMLRPKPGDLHDPSAPSRSGLQDMQVTGIWETFFNRGLLDIVDQSLRDAEQAIRADAKYFVFEKDDDKVWRNQDEKRQWHLNEARLNVYQKALDEVRKREWNRR